MANVTCHEGCVCQNISTVLRFAGNHLVEAVRAPLLILPDEVSKPFVKTISVNNICIYRTGPFFFGDVQLRIDSTLV